MDPQTSKSRPPHSDHIVYHLQYKRVKHLNADDTVDDVCQDFRAIITKYIPLEQSA